MNDAEVEKLLNDKPLIAFSGYTAGQVDTLEATSQDILTILDSTMDQGRVEAIGFRRAHGLFWLWVLGAYEVARTMSQARACFSDRAGNDIDSLKRHLAGLRIPFAKQEYAGGGKNPIPIKTESSVSSMNTTSKDMSFVVDGTAYSIRETIHRFRSTIASIARTDVLNDLRWYYNMPSKK